MLRKVGGLRGVGNGLGTPIPVLSAVNGDIGIIRAPNGKRVMALCNGHLWLFVTQHGLQVAPYESATHTWRIGHA